MKRSNTGLFIVIGFAAVLIIVTIVGARIVIGNFFDGGVNTAADAGENVTLTFDYENFTEINVAGAWTLTINQGDGYAVTVHCPEHLKHVAGIEQRGNRLSFEDVFRFTRFKAGSLHADITMPALKRLTVDGAAAVYVTGFEQEDLGIEINGASTMTGENNRFDTLRVDLEGAGRLDFGGTESENADVDIDGVGTVILSITGGVLDGRIDGLGSIKYYGEVSENRIDIEGLGSVKKIE
jgi:hypothetical protein